MRIYERILGFEFEEMRGNKMHTFDYYNEHNESVELEVLPCEMKEAAQERFEAMVKSEGLESAIESVAGSFWQEAEANIAVGNIDYILDMMLDDESVIMIAEDKVIVAHQGA